jgi:hypothetical protein
MDNSCNENWVLTKYGLRLILSSILVKELDAIFSRLRAPGKEKNVNVSYPKKPFFFLLKNT